ncbi:MAG TPA: hypothetical protein VLC93_12340 [Myxococcota bacterium]|nr:hypothetical protein [Myxococcota bacterium]
MSRSGEMKDKYDKIRELQEQRDRQERQARDQAAELEEILEASRRAHSEDTGTPVVSSSKLSGPGIPDAKRRASTNPEDAYSSNMAKAKFASPEAFSRNRANPSTVPDGSVAGMVARVSSSISASASGTSTIREPDDDSRSENTATMTVKGLPPSRTEVTQVVRRRAPIPGKIRREPPPVAPANLATTLAAVGPAIVIKDDALPASAGPARAPSDDTPIVVPQVQRVTFQRPKAQPGAHRMVTNRPANYGSFKSMTTQTQDTAPFGPDTRRFTRGQIMKDLDTVPSGPPNTAHEITAPGGREPAPSFGAPEHDTSPGMGDGGLDPTSPGGAGIESTSPGMVEVTPMPDTFPGTVVERLTNDPTAADDQRYKRVREIDALIARFAADVEVKVGQGRDNTFLRKRSDILREAEVDDFDADFPEESTQPRHRNVEIRSENTEIIPRRLPPRKRK